jgi:hypothetical protein
MSSELSQPSEGEAVLDRQVRAILRRQRALRAIQEQDEKFRAAVGTGKVYVDFFGMVVTNTLLCSVGGFLFEQLENGWSTKAFLAAMFSGVVAVSMLPSLIKATDAVAEGLFLRMLRLLGVLHVPDIRSTGWQALVRFLIQVAAFVMTIGASAFGYALAKKTLGTLTL